MDRWSRAKGFPVDQDSGFNVTAPLRQEHEDLGRMMKILGLFCFKLDKNEPINTDHLEQAVDFLRIYGDGCHNGKEEGLLYPRFGAHGGDRIKKMIMTTLNEHEIERTYLNAINRILCDYREKKPNAAVWLAVNISKYISFQKIHMDKENHVIFPMIENYLCSSIKSKLIHAFERMEETEFGSGGMIGFQKLLNQLAETYSDSFFQRDAERDGNRVYMS